MRLLGPSGCLTGADAMAGYVTDWRDLYRGRARCVLRPASVAEFADVMAYCHVHGIAVVPQGGNTGLAGAAVPDGSGQQVVVSTTRLRQIRSVDAVDMSIVAEAGITIAELQSAAGDAGALFPLSFAAEGSATLGGAVATNAGGTAAVRYGSARDLLLGVEVVLADGRVWNGLRTLHKDNAGYALRHLFAGSEGTLGIVTAAAMRLVPRPAGRAVAFTALADEAAVGAFWALLRARCAGAIRAAEYISGHGLALVMHEMGLRAPVARAAHHVLVELNAASADGLCDLLEGVLAEALEQGIITDAAVAQNEDQCAAFWRLREDQTEAQKRAGVNYKHDIAVPISRVGELLARCRAALAQRCPDLLVLPFGHLGDGNIHMNVVRPAALGAAPHPEEGEVAGVVHDIVAALGGTFSAEHGIGRTKTDLLETLRPAVELDLMRRIKAALDPAGLMNPGKVLRQE
nr:MULTISPECIES: FAD-binding oxidoreductase [unclassified Bradyrhizobium]